jgi:DNA uptake protein ComE-like DNA-binding protein
MEAGEFPQPWEGTAYRRELNGFAELWERGQTFGENFKPFSFSGNNFAFSLPESKGMSSYQLARYYEDALKAKADPSILDRWLETGQQREQVYNDIIQRLNASAESNGIGSDDRARIMGSATSKVRGEYYGDLWKAIEDQDWDAADQAARILARLGADETTAERSAARRAPDLTDEQIRRGMRELPANQAEANAPIDINTASAEELELLPGIGPATAELIVESRQRRTFGSPRELLRIDGLGWDTIQDFEQYITLEGDNDVSEE